MERAATIWSSSEMKKLALRDSDNSPSKSAIGATLPIEVLVRMLIDVIMQCGSVSSSSVGCELEGVALVSPDMLVVPR